MKEKNTWQDWIFANILLLKLSSHRRLKLANTFNTGEQKPEELEIWEFKLYYPKQA